MGRNHLGFFRNGTQLWLQRVLLRLCWFFSPVLLFEGFFFFVRERDHELSSFQKHLIFLKIAKISLETLKGFIRNLHIIHSRVDFLVAQLFFIVYELILQIVIIIVFAFNTNVFPNSSRFLGDFFHLANSSESTVPFFQTFGDLSQTFVMTRRRRVISVDFSLLSQSCKS